MPEYTKHIILNTMHVFYIYNKNNLHPFSIFYNIFIISFLSLCVSKCVAWKYSIFIINPVYTVYLYNYSGEYLLV